MTASRTVDIEFVIDESASLPESGLIRGGFRIMVAGEAVTRYETDRPADVAYDWQSEYVGEYLLRDLGNLLNALAQIQQGEVEVYEPIETGIEAHDGYVLMEPLDHGVVRLAFRSHPDGSHSTPVPPDVATGVAVDLDAVVSAVINASNNVLDDPAIGHDAVQPERDVLRDRINVLNECR